MTFHDQPTPDEFSAAARKFDSTVARGRNLRARRRIASGSGAVLVVAGVAATIALTAGGSGRPTSVEVNTNPTNTTTAGPPTTAGRSRTRATAPPTTAPPTTTLPTTVPPTTTTTTISLSQAATSLPAYVSAQTNRYNAEAPNSSLKGSEHSLPVRDGNEVIAAVAYQWVPDGMPMQIIRFDGTTWTVVASLPETPCNGCLSPHQWLDSYITTPIESADVTGDGLPDFLVYLNAADNVPGAVVSQDGASGLWRYISGVGGGYASAASDTFVRDAVFVGNSLKTTYNNCTPDCAQGTNTTITWTYDPSTGEFTAPNPPGTTTPTT